MFWSSSLSIWDLQILILRSPLLIQLLLAIMNSFLPGRSFNWCRNVKKIKCFSFFNVYNFNLKKTTFCTKSLKIKICFLFWSFFFFFCLFGAGSWSSNIHLLFSIFLVEQTKRFDMEKQDVNLKVWFCMFILVMYWI